MINIKLDFLKNYHSFIFVFFLLKGYDNTLPFIVAQDPLEKTTNEFWWMIVEHSVRIVVMLSDLDDGPNGCHLYWPSNIETFDCDFVKVKRIEEEISQHFIRRVFVVTRKKVKYALFEMIDNQFILFLD